MLYHRYNIYRLHFKQHSKKIVEYRAFTETFYATILNEKLFHKIDEIK